MTQSTSVFLFLPLLALATAGPAKYPRFTIETASGLHAGCELQALDDTGLTASDGGAPVKHTRLLELRREASALPPFLTRDFVLLTTGDRIKLDSSAGAVLQENRLHVWPAKESLPAANAKGLSLYLPHVVAAFWSLPEGIDDAEVFITQLENETRKRDVAYLKNGDRIEGSLTGLSAKTGAVMSTGGKQVETPWSRLAGLAWSTQRAVRPRAKKSYARAVLEGGTRLSFLDLHFDGKTRTLSGKTLFVAALEFPETSLLALDIHRGPAADLSDMPVRYEQRPYLGARWPLAKDAAVNGHALKLAGSAFEKGLGMHAPARAHYQLDGQFERFDALVGIDESSRRGRARLALELDGKRIELNDGKELTARDAPLTLRQDVRGVRSLTLIVELGAFGDVEANINWAKARLVKKE